MEQPKSQATICDNHTDTDSEQWKRESESESERKKMTWARAIVHTRGLQTVYARGDTQIWKKKSTYKYTHCMCPRHRSSQTVYVCMCAVQAGAKYISNV